MGKLTESHIKTLENFDVKVIESDLSQNGGHIIIADIVHCSSGRGREWREERSLTLRTSEQVFRYLNDIS